MSKAKVNPAPISPMNDRVLVRRCEMKAKTSGGLYIADTAKEKPMFGVVVAAGDGVRDTQMLRTGSLVLFGKYSGFELPIDADQLLLMREEEILGVVTDKQFAERIEVEGA